MACKLCDGSGHNSATCPEGQAAVGIMINVCAAAGPKPDAYLKLTRSIGDANLLASVFVLFATRDVDGEKRARAEMKRIRKIPGWGLSSVAKYSPGGGIEVLIQPVTIEISEENEHDVAPIGVSA